MRPMRVAEYKSFPTVAYWDDETPMDQPPYLVVTMYPVYINRLMAVYRLDTGTYAVTKGETCWGVPFVSTDFDLARIVCDRWAVEFGA